MIKFYVGSHFPFDMIKIIHPSKWAPKDTIFNEHQARIERIKKLIHYYSTRNYHQERKRLRRFEKELIKLKEEFPEYFI
jgi:hypothetical protein